MPPNIAHIAGEENGTASRQPRLWECGPPPDVCPGIAEHEQNLFQAAVAKWSARAGRRHGRLLEAQPAKAQARAFEGCVRAGRGRLAVPDDHAARGGLMLTFPNRPRRGQTIASDRKLWTSGKVRGPRAPAVHPTQGNALVVTHKSGLVLADCGFCEIIGNWEINAGGRSKSRRTRHACALGDGRNEDRQSG